MRFFSRATTTLLSRATYSKACQSFPQTTQLCATNINFATTRFSTNAKENHENPKGGTTNTNIIEEEGFNAYNPRFNSLQEEIRDASKRYHNIIDIHDTLDRGRGVSAARSFSEGEKVMTAKAIKTIPRNSHSVQKSWDEHIMIDLPARFINHSCNANVGILDNEFGGYDFFALRKIGQGEELLWDYECSEYEIMGFDTCLCGDSMCRGSVSGFKKHGEQIKRQYGKYYANYLK